MMTKDTLGHDGYMPQNIYDDEVFFSAFKTLRLGETGLNGALEWPAMKAQLPDLNELSILDLGCGFGNFARLARTQGARSVIGVDASSRMVTEAKAQALDPGITYLHTAIEAYLPRPGEFDLVVSSMAFHYLSLASYAETLEKLYECLKPGGRLVFTVEHPICTAFPVGWIVNDAGEAIHWPIDRYSDESQRLTCWFIDGVIKHHRTIATYVNSVLNVGFRLMHLGEPTPTPEQLHQRTDLQNHCRRPPILLLVAEKPK